MNMDNSFASVNELFNTQHTTENPSFDFLKILKNDNTDNEGHSLFNLNYEDSPYDTFNINCSYASVTNVHLNTNHLNIMSLNIQSINSKFSDFKDFLYEMDQLPDIICLQELWQFPCHTAFSINGYYPMIYKLRNNDIQGGGVGFYIKTGISYCIDIASTVFHDRVLETLIIEINLNNNKLLIGSLYRPGSKHPTLTQSEQYELFFELFSNQLATLSDRNLPTFLFGDINIDVLKYSSSPIVSNYVDLMFSYGFIQTITRPTRCCSNSSTLIDHCITNSTNCNHYSHIITTSISDHFPILYSIETDYSRPLPKFIESKNFSNTNIEKFLAAFNSLNWDLFYSTNNTQDACDLFYENFLTLYKIYFPTIKRRFNAKFDKIDPWFTKGLLVSRRKKIILDKKAAKHPNPANILQFKQYRNLYNKVIREAKKNYFNSQLLKNQSNLKNTWNLIRCAINRKPKKDEQNVLCLFNNNILHSDPITIANILNEFFVNVPLQIIDQLPPPPACPNATTNNTSSNLNFKLSDNQVSDDEIYNAIGQLLPKKSTDLNDISMDFVKKCSNSLINQLKHIINLSFTNGYVPTQFKTAKIVPIFKSGDPRIADNYRPIALLDNFSKIMEKIMYTRLSNYLENNDLISSCQYGFRKNHSTIHPMIQISNFISKSFNNEKHALGIFCDLRKAFDTVNHDLLLKKLSKLGINGVELSWFSSYLKGRKQFVRICGVDSLILDILYGVPQGSILGPLLFLIFIDDLPDRSSLLSLLFADDAALLDSDEDIDVLFDRVNAQFYKICT